MCSASDSFLILGLGGVGHFGASRLSQSSSFLQTCGLDTATNASLTVAKEAC